MSAKEKIQSILVIGFLIFVILPLIFGLVSYIVVFNSKRRLLPRNGEQVAATDSSEGNDQLGSPAHSD